MKIRAAKPGDENAVAQIIIDTWKDAYKGIVSQCFLDSLTTEKHEALLAQQIAQSTQIIYVLESEQNTIQGMISGGVDRSEKYDCEIVAIYIGRDYQKFGFGKRLFSACVNVFRAQGYKTMVIWTFASNKDRAFYDKMGGVVAEHKTYPIGNEDLPLVGYVWDDIEEIRNISYDIAAKEQVTCK